MSFFNDVSDLVRIVFFCKPVHTRRRLTVAGTIIFSFVLLIWLAVTGLIAAWGTFTFDYKGIAPMFMQVSALLLTIAAFAHSRRAGRSARLLCLVGLAVYVQSYGVALVVGQGAQFLPATSELQWGLFGFLVALPLIMIVPTAFLARHAFRMDQAVRRPLGAGFAFASAMWLSCMAIPNWPMFVPADFRPETANYWEIGRFLYRATSDTQLAESDTERSDTQQKSARTEMKQAERVLAAIDAMPMREAGKSNLFVLGVAGYDKERVFADELDKSLNILDSAFSIAGRSMRLVNDRRDLDSYPLASVANLNAALKGMAARMDARSDVLLLNMTSHGSRDGFMLANSDMVYRLVHPDVLKEMLDTAGIRNRIIVVSSCYSGTFIKTFADENTAIFTAAAEDRTSFGCSDSRDWTYFGDAFFNNGLKTSRTLNEAFDRALQLIGEWEAAINIPASRPQRHVGKMILALVPEVLGTVVSTPGDQPATSLDKRAAIRSPVQVQE